MNATLTKYLSDVLRNEVQEKTGLGSKGQELKAPALNDPKVSQFLIDRKYALRLDEII
ncbi:hypothetical protein ICN48_07440 [Polynucleobacter sp. JS-Safj-400b-B2]|jgi:hypothetical protein|uniref:hypothetical protein n=1 Tax=Polynucleobacter sp. JS-Safj-400b-B2 TaxID=2576921 RepID=UPI001C0D2381|nr:hypothetical protein [Polynucleobacter sp. JS-Safj-400b-B2]MBU3626066.1 hypothetical protein [Polynucleobacter sp. JS-Safj-400b-B2]